jgi:excinuclease ABC subunit A
VLHRLVDAGNTVIVIEHNLDVVKTADWIVDLGPEGGDRGGEVVAQGPPERVARTPGSYTGQFLAGTLGLDPVPTPDPAGDAAPARPAASTSRRAPAAT